MQSADGENGEQNEYTQGPHIVFVRINFSAITPI